jgi:hypothetical protein
MKAHKDLRFTEARKLGHSAQHRASGFERGSWGRPSPRLGVVRQRQRTRKGSSNVVEAVASASRYKRYKIGGK